MGGIGGSIKDIPDLLSRGLIPTSAEGGWAWGVVQGLETGFFGSGVWFGDFRV